MSPKRPFRRRPPLRNGGLRPIPPRARQALRRAHRAMERGDTSEAALIFHRLAGVAARRGQPLRAAGLTMAAALAEAKGHEAQQAVAHASQALQTFAETGRLRRIAPVAERVIATLRRSGHEAQAAELEERLEAVFQAAGLSRQETGLAVGRPRGRSSLPAKCPSCGGPLLPNEVQWSDPETAVCSYCASPVKVA